MGDDSARLMAVFRNMINDSYCRDISVKIRSQLDVKRKNGEFIGSFAAYGYKKDPKDKNHLIIDEYPAEIVQHIYRMRLNGYSTRRIVGRLDELGALPPLEYKRKAGMNFNGGFRSNGNGKWSLTAVRRILENELYTGVMLQGKMRKINYKVKDVREVDASEWIRVEGTHEAIIPLPVFQAVQDMNAQDTRTAPGQDTLYLFGGLLKCGTCGQNMIRRNAYRDANGCMLHFFHCSTYKHTGGCTSHLIPERLLEPAVLSAIKSQAKALDDAARLIEDARSHKDWEGSMNGAGVFARQIREAEQEEKQFLDLKAKAYQDMRDGVVSGDDFMELSHSFAVKAEAARQRKERLIKDRESAMTNGEPVWLEDFRRAGTLESLDRNTVVTLVEKIVIHSRDEIEIVFRFSDEIENYLSLAEEWKETVQSSDDDETVEDSTVENREETAV